MRGLRRLLDRIHPYFAKGGPYERFHAVYEAIDTFLYSPGDVTRSAPHVRDGIDLKRVMIFVWVAAFPAILAGLWNTGYQANAAMAVMEVQGAPGWRGVWREKSKRVGGWHAAVSLAPDSWVAAVRGPDRFREVPRRVRTPQSGG